MEQNEYTISLNVIWKIFVSHVWQIILLGALVFAMVTGYSALTYEEEYTSNAQVYILKNEGSESAPTASDFRLGIDTIEDCKKLIVSKTVLDRVISELALTKPETGKELGTAELKKMVTIKSEGNSRILDISVTAPTSSDAKQIIDKIMEVGAVLLQDTMGIDQVNVVGDGGSVSEVPSNSVVTVACFVAGLAASVLLMIIYVVVYISNDKITSTDDVKEHLNLPVLGFVPDSSLTSAKKGKYGYLKRYAYTYKRRKSETGGAEYV